MGFLPKATVGDTIFGMCVHPPKSYFVMGKIASGAASVFIGGKPVAKVGSSVVTSCPECGTATLVSGDATVFVEGMPLGQIASSAVLGSGCPAVTISGNGSVT